MVGGFEPTTSSRFPQQCQPGGHHHSPTLLVLALFAAADKKVLESTKHQRPIDNFNGFYIQA